MISAALAALLLQQSAPLATPANPQQAQSRWPAKDADYVAKGFRFGTGERMDVRIRYATLGTPHRNAAGEIDNAVLLLHGTGGTGRGLLLAPPLADELYGPGQPLDIRKYWIIAPDSVGHGGSSKPSNGMRMSFPKYDYVDMVKLHHRLASEALGIKRMRLIFGTSMGCMHIFTLAQIWPDWSRALMPMACQPVELAGLNRMWRQMSIDAITADPLWQGGNYTAQPVQGLRAASSISVIAGANPLYFQKMYPTRQAATDFVRQRIAADVPTRDANDYIYQLEASRNYNPWPGLEKITAPTSWLNSADDFINPYGLSFPEQALKRMPNARFRMIPQSEDTRGHGTHTWARFWKADMADLLARTEAQ